MIKADAEPGERIRCPHCRRKLVVPAGLASLPRPHVSPNVADPIPGGQDGQFLVASPFMAAMAGLMPWVLSAVLHFGLFLVMVFIVMISAEPQTRARQPVQLFNVPPKPGRMGGFRNPRKKLVSDGPDARPRVIRRPKSRETGIERGETDKPVNLLGPGAEGLESSAQAERWPIGLADRDVRGGPEFIGVRPPTGPGVYNVVYIVDRSGSMAASFDGIRMLMIESIRRLRPHHSFHIVLFGDDKAIEGPRSHLVPADEKNKNNALRFLTKQRPAGRTTALVALRRAFRVLEHADKNRPGKLIYLLSDGDFAGISGGSRYRTAHRGLLNGNEAVLQWLRDHNRSREVLINTFLLDSTDRVAIDVLRTIAQEHGGRFKYLSPDEHP